MAFPDLQIREGDGHPDPEIRGGGEGGGLKISFFRPYGLQFGLKIWGAPRGPGPSPESATEH